MRMAWAIVALGLVLAACGAEEQPDRFSLRTPGAHTGEPPPAAAPEPQPVTRAEKRVLKGWADGLRRGSGASAAAFFSVPAEISDNAGGHVRLTSREQITEFNRGLPCGVKLLSTRRGPLSFVVGTFRLTERNGRCGASVGQTIVVAFQVEDDHITRWMRDAAALGVAPEATPTPTPSGSG